MVDLFSVKKKYWVYIPDYMTAVPYTGDIYGFYHESTGVFNITARSGGDGRKFLGTIVKGGIMQQDSVTAAKGSNGQQDSFAAENDGDEKQSLEMEAGEAAEHGSLTGIWDDGVLRFYYQGREYKAKKYALEKNVFSRNSGILETDWMLDKCVFILGCGSVGSFASLELARAGTGRFVLVDNDILEYHNLCRHQCGIHEVGAFKVEAVKKRILDINPCAEVHTYKNIVENLPKEVYDRFAGKNTLFIGCADNREADIYANRISMMYGSAYLSAGFWERAFAGEIFYHLPEQNMPCYKCAVGSGGDVSARTTQSRRLYTMEENLEDLNFEPGIAADIDFVSVIAVKLAIDILNRFNEWYIPKLLPYLKQFTLVCNTCDVRAGGEMAEIFSYPLQVTRNIKTDFNTKGCPPCRYLEKGRD